MTLLVPAAATRVFDEVHKNLHAEDGQEHPYWHHDQVNWKVYLVVLQFYAYYDLSCHFQANSGDVPHVFVDRPSKPFDAISAMGHHVKQHVYQ